MFSIYCASKWAVEGFTEAISHEVKPEVRILPDRWSSTHHPPPAPLPRKRSFSIGQIIENRLTLVLCSGESNLPGVFHQRRKS